MFKLNKYGELEIDNVLFEASYPILFTCVNQTNELFLCVCCQNNADGTKWLITKTDENIIISMLKDNITIRDAFLKYPECRISVYDGDELIIKEQDTEDWGEDSIYLPKKSEFMDADPGEFDDDIAYYCERNEKLRQKENKEECINCMSITFTLNNCNIIHNKQGKQHIKLSINTPHKTVAGSWENVFINGYNILYGNTTGYLKDIVLPYNRNLDNIETEFRNKYEHYNSKRSDFTKCLMGTL